MHLMDTAGQEDYAELRVLGHANTNCFIVSFSVADKVDLIKDLNFRSGIQTKVQYLAILIKIRPSFFHIYHPTHKMSQQILGFVENEAIKKSKYVIRKCNLHENHI